MIIRIIYMYCNFIGHNSKLFLFTITHFPTHNISYNIFKYKKTITWTIALQNQHFSLYWSKTLLEIKIVLLVLNYLTKWRADWRCRSQTSISFDLGQYAGPSRRWGPSIRWSCHSITVLASLFRACPRPCLPSSRSLCRESCLMEYPEMTVFSYLQFKQPAFGTCDTNHFVRDASCPAYLQHVPQGPHFECFQALLWHFADGPCLDAKQQCWPDIAFDESYCTIEM